MAKELKDLQKLIEEKASRRFHEDYNSLTTPIQNSPLFSNLDGSSHIFQATRNSGNKEMVSAAWIFREGYGIYEALKKHWLPIYISEESELFMKEVENLKESVDGLMNGNYQPQDY